MLPDRCEAENAESQQQGRSEFSEVGALLGAVPEDEAAIAETIQPSNAKISERPRDLKVCRAHHGVASPEEQSGECERM